MRRLGSGLGPVDRALRSGKDPALKGGPNAKAASSLMCTIQGASSAGTGARCTWRCAREMLGSGFGPRNRTGGEKAVLVVLGGGAPMVLAFIMEQRVRPEPSARAAHAAACAEGLRVKAGVSRALRSGLGHCSRCCARRQGGRQADPNPQRGGAAGAVACRQKGLLARGG